MNENGLIITRIRQTSTNLDRHEQANNSSAHQRSASHVAPNEKKVGKTSRALKLREISLELDDPRSSFAAQSTGSKNASGWLSSVLSKKGVHRG